MAKVSNDSAPSIGVEVVRGTGPTKTRHAIEATMVAQGLIPVSWENGADVIYDRHSHPNQKVLYCVAGSIVFHTAADDVMLAPGDRMELPAGVTHSATVGPGGVECVEAFRP